MLLICSLSGLVFSGVTFYYIVNNMNRVLEWFLSWWNGIHLLPPFLALPKMWQNFISKTIARKSSSYNYMHACDTQTHTYIHNTYTHTYTNTYTHNQLVVAIC